MVGAYERDNFGDLLFLLVTEQYLPDAEVVAAAPFSADMNALLDRDVRAYGPLLRSEEFDAIWTVGGQVGGIDLHAAYRMSVPAEVYRQYQRSSEDEQARLLRRAVGDVPVVSPYIPAPLAYPSNAGAITVLNSVGLDGVRVANPYRREELISVLRGGTFISVRDMPSSEYLSSLGIEHRLVPDAVHAISRLRPAEPDPSSDVAIVQASGGIIRKLGAAKLAEAIATSAQLRDLRIRFLMAGAATGHDSVDNYRDLIDRIRRIEPDLDLGIIEDRRPWDLVDHIRRARVVISSSLHVRIVASSYGVPRVTFERNKPTKYAQTWDPGMPYGVTAAKLDQAVGSALALAGDPDELARSAELSGLAHDNLLDLSGQVMALARTQSQETISRRRDARRQQQAELLANRTSRDAEVAALESELTRTRRELAAIKSSRSYQLASYGVRVGRAIQRRLNRLDLPSPRKSTTSPVRERESATIT